MKLGTGFGKLVMVIALVVFAMQSMGAVRIGYIVTVQDNVKADLKYFETQSAQKVEQSFENNTGIEIDVEEVLSGSNVFFEYRSSNVAYYVEKKRVIRKKNGELKYKKLRKKDLRALKEK